MKARAVSLRSSPSSTHHLSWLSPPHSLSLIAATLHSASLGIPLLRSPPNGVVTLLTLCPSCCHSPPFSAPWGPPPQLTADRGCHPHQSLSLGAVSLPTHCSHGRHPLPLTPPLCVPSGRLPRLPRVLTFSFPAPSSPALSPWQADPWLPTPLPPPLKPPPLDNQSGPGRGQESSGIATNQSVAPPP